VKAFKLVRINHRGPAARGCGRMSKKKQKTNKRSEKRNREKEQNTTKEKEKERPLLVYAWGHETLRTSPKRKSNSEDKKVRRNYQESGVNFGREGIKQANIVTKKLVAQYKNRDGKGKKGRRGKQVQSQKQPAKTPGARSDITEK